MTRQHVLKDGDSFCVDEQVRCWVDRPCACCILERHLRHDASLPPEDRPRTWAELERFGFPSPIRVTSGRVKRLTFTVEYDGDTGALAYRDVNGVVSP